jgi:penicillin-binding protein 1A
MSLKRGLTIFACLVLLGLFVGGVATVGIFYHFSRGLPDYRQLAEYKPPVMTRVYAGDGSLVQEYAVEGRVFVPIGSIPKRVIDAFVASEDQRFYTHPGVDPIGLTRAIFVAVFEKITGSDRRIKGASTITQQVAQRFLLGKEYSFDRKIREAILSLRIERAFTKDHILELYLNENYLGFGAYGVAAGAMNYFNKSLNELTIAEAAFLAGLFKAPNNYNPLRQYDAAKERRDYVIGRMQDEGYISREEAKVAVEEPIVVKNRAETEMVSGADYFAENIRRELAAKFGEDALYKGGLAVRTSLDPELQMLANKVMRAGLLDYDRDHGWRGPITKIAVGGNLSEKLRGIQDPLGLPAEWTTVVVTGVEADKAQIAFRDGKRGTIPLAELRWARKQLENQHLGEAVRAASQVVTPGDVVAVEAVTKNGETAYPADTYALRQLPEVEGAMVVMDPHTGRVLAMNGGFSYARSQFNRATQALRQPGSSFKPFVYLTAMENGYTPSTLVLDAPFVMDQGPGLPKWKPKNYTDEYLGRATLRIGLEKSQNLMTVRVAQAVGMDKVVKTAENFGLVDKMQPNLSAALGSEVTTVLRLTTGYAQLVNGGKKLTPVLIDRIQDRNGKTIFRSDARPCPTCAAPTWDQSGPPALPDDRAQLADPASAYQIVHLLEGVVQSGTARAVAQVGKPLAGKTGTSNDAFDVWFIGFSPDLVAGVFIGFDEPRSLGPKITGGGSAAPIFRDFMKEALKDKPATPFRVPPGVSLVRVDHDSGRPAQPGDRFVILEGFKTGTSPETQVTILGQSDESEGGVPGANLPNQPAAGGLY